jgi:hypothetical protein
MMNETTTTTIRKDEEFAIKKHGRDYRNFPWVLTINAGTEDEYTMCFRTLNDAAEAAKSWHGKK